MKDKAKAQRTQNNSTKSKKRKYSRAFKKDALKKNIIRQARNTTRIPFINQKDKQRKLKKRKINETLNLKDKNKSDSFEKNQEKKKRKKSKFSRTSMVNRSNSFITPRLKKKIKEISSKQLRESKNLVQPRKK